MKIVNIIGGLGNQMFQYALVIALRERFKEDIYVDITSFRTYGLHNGLELEKVFNIKLLHATNNNIKKLAYFSTYYKLSRFMLKYFPKKNTMCCEFPLAKFDKTKLYANHDMYYDGYWQHYSYFNEYKDIILREYQFKGNFSEEAQIISSKIVTTNSIAIHVRRGDYLKDKYYGGICNLDYYKSAIEYFNNKGKRFHYFIFSNEIEWCKENIAPILTDYTLVDCHKGIDSYKDMWLMSFCKNMILANSSFSWWAAYLNKNEGDILAPKIWTRNPKTYQRQLPHWILV